MEETNIDEVDYCGNVNKSHKGFIPDTFEKQQNIGWEGIILLWRVLRQFLDIYLLWTLGTSKPLVRYYDLFILRGVVVMIQFIPTYLF